VGVGCVECVATGLLGAPIASPASTPAVPGPAPLDRPAPPHDLRANPRDASNPAPLRCGTAAHDARLSFPPARINRLSSPTAPHRRRLLLVVQLRLAGAREEPHGGGGAN
ncbi:unnamed protein product, partial [Urochloa humidicola]